MASHSSANESTSATTYQLATMAAALASITVEDFVFPSSVLAPASAKSFYLAGAGVRGLMIEGNFVKFTAIGIYLDVEAALPSLALKWKGKPTDELAQSVDFFRDIVSGNPLINF